MPKIADADRSWSDAPLPEGDAEDFKVLTAQEAEGWRSRQAKISMGWILCVQCAVLISVVVLLFWATPSGSVALSFACGGGAVGLPAVLMFFGLKWGGAGSGLGRFAQGAVASLWFWEAIKVALSVLLLALVPLMVRNLNWLAFLAGLVLVLKVYWVALILFSRRAPHH